jgi:hypothetical protein
VEIDFTRMTDRIRARRSGRVLAVRALGPLTACAGVVWAIAQPYRLTFLDPRGHGFWWLVSVPPVYVILVGAAFHFLVAPGVVRDLEGHDPE